MRVTIVIREYDLNKLDALPKSLYFYGASDYATMSPRHGKRDPDFTEHFVMGLDHVGDMWFVDNWSGQTETDVGVAQFIRLIGIWKCVRWFNEGGLLDKALGPTIRSAMSHSQKFVAIESLPSLEDKAVKLQAFHARATAGTVHIPIRRKWAEDLIDQLVKFPGGRWDDKADCCGLLGRGVDKMFDARIPVATRVQNLVPFTEKWLEYGSGNEKPKVRYW